MDIIFNSKKKIMKFYRYIYIFELSMKTGLEADRF